MTLEWDPETIAFQTNVSDMTSQPPRKFTFQTERFCPICKNPQTLIKDLKGLKKYLNKESMKFLLEHIEKNNLNKFTIKELIKSFNAENITEGDLLRKNLVVLVSSGYFNRINEEWTRKNGTKGIRYLFIKNWFKIPPKCYDEEKDRHKEVIWERKTIFDSKANKEKDDTITT